MVAPDYLLDGVAHDRLEHAEPVLHSPARAGEVDHQAVARDAGETAREHRGGYAVGDAGGPWAAGVAKNRSTWYQPLEDEEEIRLAVKWVLARPGIFLNSVGDVDLLPAVLKAADARAAMPPEPAMAGLAERAGLASIFGL